MGNWKTISSKVVYKNPRFSIREDKIIRPNGEDGVYYVMDRAPVVVITPLTKDNEIYLIKINRYTTKKTHWEIPAGSSDKQNELIAARRELKEETGLVSSSWVKLGEVEVAPGMTGQLAHVFVAQDVKLTKEHKQIKENIHRIKKVPFKKVLKMIKGGEIVNGPTIASIMKVGLKLKLTT